MIYLMFVFGTFIGSFLNVVIYRLNPALQLKSGVFGRRSMCFNCKTILKWYNLVPILSFFWLHGKCRYCQKKISWQYPIVEILSGLIWVLLARRSFSEGWGFFDFIYLIFIFSALLVIAVYDFKWRIIPDKVVYPSIVVALVFNFLKSLNFEILKFLNIETFKLLNLESFVLTLLTACAAFLFFFLINFLSKGRAMGLGDAKLGFLIGLFLGPLYSFISFTTSFIIGAVFGILLVVLKKKSWKSQIAFGPFLVLGAFITFFFSNFIIKFLNL